jgi:peptidoglycan glycosyltransferase
LEAVFRRWRLDVPPSLEIPTEAGDTRVVDPQLAAVGQEALTVTPLQMALVVAAVGTEGVTPTPSLVLTTEGVDGTWRPAATSAQPARVIRADLAQRLRTLLRPSSGGQVIGHSSIALAGADRPPHVWYIGLAPVQAPRFAVAVLLEHGGGEGPNLAERVGRDALVAALGRTP